MTEQPARTPYAHKVRYGVTGAPTLTEDEMDDSYAPGIGVSPTLIELVYSAARDGKPASVSASVTGWWMRHGERVQPEGEVTLHYGDGPDGWPEWLVEEARLHDPAVPVSSPPADRAAVDLATARATNQRLNREKQRLESELAAYRRAVADWEISDSGTYVPLRTLAAIAMAAGVEVPARWELHYQRVERLAADRAAELDRLRTENERMRHELQVMYGGAFDSMTSESADRAAVLREAAAAIEKAADEHPDYYVPQGLYDAAERLRRMADETPAAEEPPADRAVLDRVCEIVRRLDAHAVGFQDVLDDSDRDPWAKTVRADIAALRRMADETPAALCVECGHPCAAHRDGDDPVTPGECTACPDDERHDYRPAVTPPPA